jgi:hypothetical protein
MNAKELINKLLDCEDLNAEVRISIAVTSGDIIQNHNPVIVNIKDDGDIIHLRDWK